MYAEGKKEWPILIIITITGGTKYTYVGLLCRNVNIFYIEMLTRKVDLQRVF